MSDSKNTPPGDEWIKSLYRTGAEMPEDKIPESADAAILKQAQLAQGTKPRKFPLYSWSYGTAASAIIGILLLMQLPTSENQSQLSLEPKSSQPTMSKLRQEGDQLSGPSAIQQTKELSVPAERTAMKVLDNTLVSEGGPLPEIAPEMTAEMPSPKASASVPRRSTGLAFSEALSDAAKSDFSDCADHIGYFTNRIQQQILVACQGGSQLRFEFEQKSASTCKEPYYFAIESPADVSPGKVDALNGIQDIIISHAGNTFTLRCDAGQWKLLLMEQP